MQETEQINNLSSELSVLFEFSFNFSGKLETMARLNGLSSIRFSYTFSATKPTENRLKLN